MNATGKDYLRLQFSERIKNKSASEFQSFFEDIMGKADPDFQKIRPLGELGDRGNDGYIPAKGIYFQSYAPINPGEKQADAAAKLNRDYNTLKENWDEISKIKAYRFVFNDKGMGSNIVLEKTLSELRDENKGVEFRLFTPRDLEAVFLGLPEEAILALGFNLDETQAVEMAEKYLKQIEGDLDWGNAKPSLKSLKYFKVIISDLGEESLQVKFELLEARALVAEERIGDAKAIFESLTRRYPKDPRAFLYLAEYYFGQNAFDENDRYLKLAEAVDANNWQLRLIRLFQSLHLKSKIDISKIDETTFPKEARVKSCYYRVHSLLLEHGGDHERAISFIERAVSLNPRSIDNYTVKFGILHERIVFSEEGHENLEGELTGLLAEIDALRQKTSQWGDIGPRDQAIFNFIRFELLTLQADLSVTSEIAKEEFNLLLQCYFDCQIDELLSRFLLAVSLPMGEIKRLLSYLEKATKPISDNLAKAILVQFMNRDAIFVEGRKFFESNNRIDILEFIDDLEGKNIEAALAYLDKDIEFSSIIIGAAKRFPELRRLFVETMPDDGSGRKQKLNFFINYDENNIDEAFAVLKTFDLTKLNNYECRSVLEVARDKGAWDTVLDVATRLLPIKKNKHDNLNINIFLCNANSHLGRYKEAALIGESILSDAEAMKFLDDCNQENLLWLTVVAMYKRGEYSEAQNLVEKHKNIPQSFEFSTDLAPAIYLKNNEPQRALQWIIEGVKAVRKPSPEQYGGLFIVLNRISNLIPISLDPAPEIAAECFVKLQEQPRWYYIGDGNELDATKVPPTDEKYKEYIGKSVHEKVAVGSRFAPDKTEFTIENILPVDGYVLWQCSYYAQELSKERRWDMMGTLEIPKIGEDIDVERLIVRLEELQKSADESFRAYCQNQMPLAFLAISHGGLIGALGRLLNEKRGFIHFSSGSLEELNQQKEVAKRIIAGESFFIDGTSALMLTESGFLEKTGKFLPGLKIPQSVINMLLELKEKFEEDPDSMGKMAIVRGRLILNRLGEQTRISAQRDIAGSIRIFEDKPENIVAISNASKSAGVSEQKVPPELCDACILSRRNHIPVMTEDYLYLLVNKADTKDEPPEYCSTFALMRVLYEQGNISFDEYLAYFNYLANYRFRFLPISVADLRNTVIGEGQITLVHPKNINQLNLPLTLSLEYGVPFRKALGVVGRFLIDILLDGSIPPETAEGIFMEILAAFPADIDKGALGKLLLETCSKVIPQMYPSLIIVPLFNRKYEVLLKSAEIYPRGEVIIF